MKKLTVLGSGLTVALLSAPVMAVDFHALAGVQTAPAPIQDTALIATEGGTTCDAPSVETAGGVVLCTGFNSGISGGGIARFSVTNDPPITGAQFLQVVK